MFKLVGKWLKVYEDEIGLFFWAVILLFFIRTSSILFNNFAETAFLKRFGVEYLPLVMMANSIVTFFIMAVLTGIMARLPGARLLFYMLIFCGTTVAALRFVIPLGFDFIYPVMYVLKAQYEALLALVFWNLANDLFNTRQSKRLFPLITAGGVIGGIIGSFGTPFLARAISMDNLMLAYLCTTTLCAIAVKKMGANFPALLVSDKKEKKAKRRTSVIEEFKKIIPIMKDSTLVKILVLLTFLPNVAIPILNYQFNFTVNQQFATQSGMLTFFGYFRGSMNIVSLIILLFIGRIYGRWGVPVILMFHPFNYMLAFLAFLLRFDIFSAMYARVSTNVIRTTMNNPGRAVLMGLFPVSYRAVIRPFLRGTVVRIGILLGAGIVMVSEGLFPPRFLSIAAMVFVGGWIASTFILKRSYSKILLDLVSRGVIDVQSMEEKDVSEIFRDKKIQSQLVQDFLSSQGDECLWYANLLNAQGVEDLDAHILSVLKRHDDKTRIELLSLLSPRAGQEAISVFGELDDLENPALMSAIVKAANRLPPELSFHFSKEVFDTSRNPEVKAYAIGGLFQQAPQNYRSVIDSWLESDEVSEKKAGLIAAGESGDGLYIPRLKEMLDKGEASAIIPHVLRGLQRLGPSEMNTIALPFLSHPLESVRIAALEAFEISDDNDLRKVVGLLGDSSDPVHELSKEKLESASYQNALLLVESLNVPRRKVREGIFDLLESLKIKDLDIFRFARSQLEMGYTCLTEAEGLRGFPENRERDLLIDHLTQKKDVQLENILRVLATEDRSGQMRTIWRGIFSADARQRSNSLEALDDSLDNSLSGIMMPLLEGMPASESLKVGRKNFDLPYFDSDKAAIYSCLLAETDWMTVVLTLNLLAKYGLEGVDRRIVQGLADSENANIRKMVQRVVDQQDRGPAKREDKMETEITIPDKILHLRGIQIFEGLSVSELGAIVSVTEEVVYPPGKIVIREGESGDTMYLIIKGEVSVIKGMGQPNEVELDRTGAGDYFGEMALFEDLVRSATIRTEQESRFLVLHKQEFKEIVREYPGIALEICKALSQRIRNLHEKIQT